MTNKEQREEWEKAFTAHEKTSGWLDDYTGCTYDVAWANGRREGWLAACEYRQKECDEKYAEMVRLQNCNCKLHKQTLDQQKKLDVLVEAIKYACSGINHSDSKTECRHCALKRALQKIKELDESEGK